MSSCECGTVAESLIELARSILGPRCIVWCVGWKEGYTERAKLAIDFCRASKAMQVRAIVESWDLDRIVRELRT